VNAINDRPTLRDFQRYVEAMEHERGFAHQTAVQKCLMLGEEIGELFKAVRKSERLGIAQNSVVGSVGDELADVFIFLCAIANRYGIDLEQAFRDKESVNESRVWK